MTASPRKPISPIPRRMSVREGICDYCGGPTPGSVSPCPTCLASVLADEATGFERRILDALRALGDDQDHTFEDVRKRTHTPAPVLRRALLRLDRRGLVEIALGHEYRLTPAGRDVLRLFEGADLDDGHGAGE